MPRNYYLFNPGRLSRKQNTIFFRRYKQVSDDKVLADFEEQIENEPEFAELDPETRYEESGDKKVIPIEDIDSIYVFGEADFNRKFFNYCGQNQIPVHIFNYYGFYSGTFYPREFLNSGELLVRQVSHQQDEARRINLARAFVYGASGKSTSAPGR
jgi:CRISPR-associated protein Cas1